MVKAKVDFLVIVADQKEHDENNRQTFSIKNYLVTIENMSLDEWSKMRTGDLREIIREELREQLVIQVVRFSADPTDQETDEEPSYFLVCKETTGEWYPILVVPLSLGSCNELMGRYQKIHPDREYKLVKFM